MAVMMPREKWTDERLDDLNGRIDEGFADTKAQIADTKAEIADTKTEMRAGFARVDGGIKELRREMNARFENLEARLDARFDALNRNQIAGFFVIVAAIIGSNAF
jgi:hypothetical protein